LYANWAVELFIIKKLKTSNYLTHSRHITTEE